MGLGGVPEVAWQLLSRLPEESYSRHVFVLGQPGNEAQSRADRRAAFEAAGIKVSFGAAAGGLLQRLGELGDWIRDQRIELLHTHSYKPNLHARLLAASLRNTGLRIVAHYHNQYDNKWQADGSIALDRQLAQATDALVACSEAVADHVAQRLSLTPNRIHVVCNGVDLQHFSSLPREAACRSLGVDPQAPVVGVVGRLCVQKGQDLFIDAAARLRSQWPNAQWLVIGAPDQPAALEHLQDRARAHGFGNDQMRFVGHRSDMPEVYSALDLLVAPSRWEGFGLMLVEAMACSTPIVATRVGAIPEVVADGRTALLVQPDDSAALAHAISAALQDAPLRARLAAAGRHQAMQFDWNRSAGQLHSIYGEVMSGKTP